jgi:hypothetical protein
MEDSPVKYRLHFKRGARLALKGTDLKGLRHGMQCGYAVTYFTSDVHLRRELTHHSYSEVIKRNKWKVGTSEISDARIEEMQNMRVPKGDPHAIWLRYDKPYEARASKYQGDTKSHVAGHCTFMIDAITEFKKKGSLAFLMLPLIHAWDGTIQELEQHLTYMLKKGGAKVVNDKLIEKTKKKPATRTSAKMVMEDGLIDKLLPLPPELKKLGFITHPG